MDNTAERGAQTIETARLRLVWMSPSFMRASLAGRRQEAEALIGAALPPAWPDDAARSVMEIRLDQISRSPATAEWLLRAMVLAATSSVVGYINFHGPPLEGRAELGYTVFEPYRRQGFATEAIEGMMDWAARQHGVERFVVSISPSNEPSLALARRLGFRRIGSQFDEAEGEEWVFELVRPIKAVEGQAD
ncbi:MAG TPA: GNAT family N-acetyltransferase [Dehalococcoidia bacterium]|nr:GNAT family N-acetyltransferase [Dehalococcoidia bacterium]